MTLSRRHTLLALFTLVLFLAMAGPIQAVVEFALDTEHTHASHIVLIPLISAALIYGNRNNIFKTVRYSALATGIGITIGTGLLMAHIAWGAQLEKATQLALIASSFLALWLSGFLFFYGTAAFKAALFPLLFLAFCIPVPDALLDRVITFLQHRSADMTFLILRLSGTPVYREGVSFTLPNLVVEIAPECSGIRSAISIFILCLLTSHLLLRSMWKKGILMLAAVPILIFKNALRISTLSLLAVHVDPQILSSQLHREGGIPFFVLALLLLYPVLRMLVRSEKSTELHPRGLPVFTSLTREADL